MCKYCKQGTVNTLIESEKISNSIWSMVGWVLKTDYLSTIENNVVIEIRNGQGYLRLGNPNDMSCLDHGDKVKINFCPRCGRELKEARE